MSLLDKILRRSEPQPGTLLQAIWKNAVLAESANTIAVDGKRYFPPEDVRWQFLRPSDKETVCLWKGQAGYYHVEVDDERNRDAAFAYPNPQSAAAELKDYVAFWRGVKVRAAEAGVGVTPTAPGTSTPSTTRPEA